jgi:phosphomannomutase
MTPVATRSRGRRDIAAHAGVIRFGTIHFGTSGWRGIIAENFTFGNVRIAVAAIAEYVRTNKSRPTLLVAHDTRFFSEEFARTAAEVLKERRVRTLMCAGATPTPAVAYEIQRRKADGAINFTASHNPADYHGLKFSGADGAPAPLEVTRKVEALAVKLGRSAGRSNGAAFPSLQKTQGEAIDPKAAYLKRLGELVRFDVIRKAKISIVYDAMHGCGAGYLDAALAEHGIPVQTMRAERDVLFEGKGPDVSATNLAAQGKAVEREKAAVGLATDGDADRFGVIDATGEFVQPNHVLGLLYDHLVETRGWRLPPGRSVATSHLVDAVARTRGLPRAYETPVGFKHIGQMILQDGVALAGEEASGLTIRGHVPDKDGILACLLVAEMIAARGKSMEEQLQDLFRRVGREYWPLRMNLHLPEHVKARAVERLEGKFKEFLGRRVTRIDRTDGVKMFFGSDAKDAEGPWVLLRLSGTEPLLRIYTEAATREEAAEIGREAQEWIFAEAKGGPH